MGDGEEKEMKDLSTLVANLDNDCLLRLIWTNYLTKQVFFLCKLLL